MVRRAILALVAACLLWQPWNVALACCMVPATYRGTISQSAQEALIVHADGREELVLRINYRIDSKNAAGELPDRFAWIITVPNEPDAYNLAARDFFEKIFDWANPLVKIPSRSLGPVASPTGPRPAVEGVELGKREIVGPYDIQPVRALGLEALEGLNRWLRTNGFPAEDREHMKYFVENKFTFLCVKVSPAGEQKSVEAGGKIPPLHLSFKSEHPYYPLKFSSRQGVFDLNLYVMTGSPFDHEASAPSLKKINWVAGKLRENVRVFPAGFPEVLQTVLDRGKVGKDRRSWHLNVLRSRKVNDDNAIASWKKDVFFATKKKVASAFPETRGLLYASLAILLCTGATAILVRRRRA